MNKRLQELAEQAGFCHDINNGIYLCAPMHMEKFAELIVRECIEQIIIRKRADGEWYQDDLLKHFGVEE